MCYFCCHIPAVITWSSLLSMITPKSLFTDFCSTDVGIKLSSFITQRLSFDKIFAVWWSKLDDIVGQHLSFVCRGLYYSIQQKFKWRPYFRNNAFVFVKFCWPFLRPDRSVEAVVWSGCAGYSVVVTVTLVDICYRPMLTELPCSQNWCVCWIKAQMVVVCQCLPPGAVTHSDNCYHHRIYEMTMASFAIAVHGHCCQRHVLGQQVVSNITVLRSWWGICILNLIMLICYYTPTHCCTSNIGIFA